MKKKKTALAKAIEWFVAFFEPLPPDARRKIVYQPKNPLVKEEPMSTKPGLYANIHAKQARIVKEKAEGKPVEKMRKPGTKGAPTAKAFKESAKTAKGK
jgi:hypothetical protein